MYCTIYNDLIVIVCFCLISLEDGVDVDHDGLTVKKSRMGKYYFFSLPYSNSAPTRFQIAFI